MQEPHEEFLCSQVTDGFVVASGALVEVEKLPELGDAVVELSSADPPKTIPKSTTDAKSNEL